MPLDAGTRFGPYEVVAPIGAGGMGEVYEARDTRLGRTVAIKVLPSELSDHPELRQRFEQEARAVSSLNHPHICTLFDVGREDGVDFLVMEYLEGETLADRLERGPIPWEEAVRHAVRLADALEKAHRAGIVHRDLKPGNVVLTKSGPKLLDFGLAKLQPGGAVVSDLSAVTEAKPLTEKGTILGTFQYMSPEQLEGKEADARTDIFALGAVLYEMVTGEKAFRGESQASLIAAIMSGTPRAMSASDALSPPALDRIVGVCLEKDPDRRWQSAADLERNLEWVKPELDAPGGTPPPAVATRGRLLAVVLGAVAGIVAMLALFSTFAGSEREVPQYFQIDIGENEGTEPGVRAHVALSPDGNVLAYTAVRGGTSRLYLRRLDEPEAKEVEGSERAYVPFFSPDGEWVAFQTYRGERGLKKVSLHGGAPQTITDSQLPLAGTWLPDDTLVLADWREDGDAGLYRTSASGGPLDKWVEVDPREELLQYPEWLPGGDTLLCTRWTREGVEGMLVSLATGERRTLIKNAWNALYVASGHIVFVRGGALWAVPFDLASQEIVGNERPILSGVEQRGTVSLAVSNAGNGLLAYVPGEEGPWVEEALSWVARDGRRTEASPEHRDFAAPRFSPTGSAVVLEVSGTFNVGSEIVTLDVASGRIDPITFRKGRDMGPVWSAEGQSIFFASDRGGSTLDLYRQAVRPAGDAELLLATEEDAEPLDVSPDGRVLFYWQDGDIYALSLADETVSPFVATDASEDQARFSPDGRFVAYVSDETGQQEVFVQPYPPTGGKRQVSRGGGIRPAWSGDGRELYYLRGSMMVAVAFRSSPSFEVLQERELFETPLNQSRVFDVDPESGRLLFVDKILGSPPRYVNVVTNFFDLLEESESR